MNRCPIIIIAILSVFFGCSAHSDPRYPYDLDPPRSQGGVGPKARDPTYRWGFANRGDHLIENVGIEWKAQNTKFSAGAGYLPNGPIGMKIDDLGWDPIPDQVTMLWTDDKINKSKVIQVAPELPDIVHFTGIIVFEFDGTEWHLRTQPLPPRLGI